MMSASSSPYGELNTANNEFRLLIILRDPHPLDNRMQCQLSIRSINDNPEYEAVSYTWGPPTENKWYIWLNGVLVPVRLNLLLALRVLRARTRQRNPWFTTFKKPRMPLSLWIDALCINQDDIDEREYQVEMMGDIFRCSRNVLAWLGTPDEVERNDPRLDVTKREVKWMPAPALIRKLEIDLGDLQASRKVREEVVELLEVDYWNRLWIIQELCLTPQVLLIRGTSFMKWEDVISTIISVGDDSISDSSRINLKDRTRKLKNLSAAMRSAVVNEPTLMGLCSTAYFGPTSIYIRY